MLYQAYLNMQRRLEENYYEKEAERLDFYDLDYNDELISSDSISDEEGAFLRGYLGEDS